MVKFDRIIYNLQLVCHCKYSSILCSHDPDHAPFFTRKGYRIFLPLREKTGFFTLGDSKSKTSYRNFSLCKN